MTEDQINQEIQSQRTRRPTTEGMAFPVREISRTHLGDGCWEIIEVVERVRVRVVKIREQEAVRAHG